MWGDAELIGRQIQLLDAARFVQICTALLSETAATHGIPRSCLAFNLRITEPDGGIDARCDASPATIGRLIPRSNVAYQFKSGGQRSAAAVAREDVLDKPRVMEALRTGNAFVYLMSWDAGDEFELRVAEAVRKGDRRRGGYPVQDQQIICIGSFAIAGLLRSFPALAFKVAGAGDATLFDIEQWRGMRRFRNSFHQDSQLEARIQELRTRMNAPSAVLRVIGAAGDGKTRTVLEAVAGSAMADSVLYAPAPNHVTPAFQQFLARTPDARCTLVIDEVDDRTAEQLANQFGVMPPQVRLLTIGVDASRRATRETVALDGLSEETLTNLVAGIATGVDAEVARSIARIAERSPKLAVLLAERVRDEPALAAPHKLLQDADVQAGLSRYLDIDDKDPAWQSVTILSLVTHVGWIAEAEVESQLLFSAVSVNPDEARQHVDALDERFGIAPLAGRFRYVSPALLADHLAARHVGSWSAARLRKVLESLGPTLLKRFAQRLRRLAAVLRNRGPVEQAIFGVDGPFTSLVAVEGSALSELLNELAPAFPGGALDALEHMIESASDAELQETRRSRRNLVWALESLLWRADTFERAATLLLRLAVTENEPSIANNASGVFVETFQTQLGRTAAGPPARLRVLARAARHPEPSARVLAAKALGAVTRTGHVSRFGMPPKDVEGMPAEAWHPPTYKEWFDLIRSALAILSTLVRDNDAAVREATVKALAEAVPTALSFPVTADWIAAADPLLNADYDSRAPVLQAILWEIRRRQSRKEIGREVDAILGVGEDPKDEFDENEESDAQPSPEEQEEFTGRILNIAQFAVRLRGDDYSSRLRRTLSRDVFATSALGYELQARRAQEELERLAEEGLAGPALIDAEWPWILQGHRLHAPQWADALGKVDRERVTVANLEEIARKQPRASMLLSLYEIAYAHAKGDADWVNRRIEELRNAGEPTLAFDLLCRAGYSEERLQLMVPLLPEPSLRGYALAELGFPPWGREMPAPGALQLLQAAKASNVPSGTAIAFIHHYLHDHPDAHEDLRDMALHFLTKEPDLESGGSSHDDYDWAKVGEAYVADHPREIMGAVLEYVAARRRGMDRDFAAVLQTAWNSGDKRVLFSEVIGPWLEGDDVRSWQVRNALEDLPLIDLGVDTLRQWIAAKPKPRAHRVAEVIGPPRIAATDVHAMLLTDFAEYSIGSAFFGALISGVFWGSAAARTRSLIPSVAPLENDSRPAVREWAASTVRALQEMADREEQREAEDRLER